ncbi:unnamed protein product, partial [Mesorhabditis spiculigera]
MLNAYNAMFVKRVGKFWCGMEKWQLTDDVAEALSKSLCSEATEKFFNRVCFIHDVCYEKLQDRDLLMEKRHEICDEDFCHILLEAAARDAGKCVDLAVTFCTAVKSPLYDVFGKKKLLKAN